MSFAQALERLRDAARIEPEDDRCVYGQRRIVNREDLAQLVQIFDEIDAMRRTALAALEARAREICQQHHRLRDRQIAAAQASMGTPVGMEEPDHG